MCKFLEYVPENHFGKQGTRTRAWLHCNSPKFTIGGTDRVSRIHRRRSGFLQGGEGVITLETCRGHSPKPGAVCLQFPSRVAQKLHFSVGNLPKKVFPAQAKKCCQAERGHTGFSGPGFLLENMINEPKKISSGEHSVRMVQYQNYTIN